MPRNVLASAFLAVILFVHAGNAEVVRCTITDRSHKLMPEWIEYEIGLRGTVIEVRDSVGQARGVDWVGGSISENTHRRFVFSWDTGIMPQELDWWGSGKVVMTLFRLPNGDVKISGIPDRPKRMTERYHAEAKCDG